MFAITLDDASTRTPGIHAAIKEPILGGFTEPGPSRVVTNINMSVCHDCSRIAVWVHDRLLFPKGWTGPVPNADLNIEIQADFNEARSILQVSPRGAAALLRLAVQKLCVQLEKPGKSINDDIADLVEDGLNPVVQKSLDAVRVIGNEAVHPGTMDLKDDIPTALALLSLINTIAEQMITFPNQIDAIYENLPESKKQAIEKRDAKKSAANQTKD